MSYCRFSDGDVYVYQGDYRTWVCCGCKFNPEQGERLFESLTGLKTHLEEHVASGHEVPRHAFDRINYEQHNKVGLLSGRPIPEECL